ncbi:DEAD/DEAH box helicase [Segatella copri]|uniref:DEAD/DEAH box helicase n=1 Tax=Segatella copri TaxID=165179 RepID=UPI0022320160|nr:DEAD/DEAH box helicase [Segatella copri]MCW4073320.1 DEAD/DEAH box helicase [Segatella copri]
MNLKLKKWIIDTVEADMRSSYRRAQALPFEYEFMDRYADFYVNMLTRMFNILNGEYSESYDEDRQKRELLNLVHGLEIFNERWRKSDFVGVNRNDNALYVAVIYYLCNYEAVAAMYIRECRLENLRTDAARMIFYIISGGECRGNEIENHGIKAWLTKGDNAELSKFKALLEERAEQMTYDNADDFFDSQLLLHVLNKFQEDNIRKDLYTFDNTVSWNQYLNYTFRKHIFSFLPSQREALHKGLLSYNRSFSLRMPTSAGKSYITELLIYQELQKTPNAKILYLAPLRSLGHELREKYRSISSQLDFTYRSLYGGSSMTGTEAILAEADLFITTPETFMSLEGSIDDILRQFTLVICDEGQLIESVGRGLDYEMLLSRLRKQEHVRFLFISAIIPNIGDINTWLGGTVGEVGESNYRPCTIRFGVASTDKTSITLHVYENVNKKSLFDFTSFVNKDESKGFKLDTQKNRACLMAMKSLDAGSVMLYSTFKKKEYNASCYKYGECIANIIQKGKLPSPRSFLNTNQRNLLDLLCEFTEYNFGTDYYETNFMKEGFAVHTGSLPQEMREIVETGYEKGALRMIICNSTLAEGVNFPIRTLVLGDIRHPSGKGWMEREVLMNVIGRVGRAGRETYGFVICADKAWWFVKEAASGENLKYAKGMLNDIAFEILKVERRLQRQLTDDEVNYMLSESGLVESIDKMLMLSTDDFTTDEDVSLDVSSSSLSYHLGNDKHKKQITRIFSVRNSYLHGLSNDNIQMYKDTLISPIVQTTLQDVISDDCGLSTLSTEDLSSDEWIEKIISLTSSLMQIDDKKKIKTLMSCWMEGLRYVEIADKMRLPIDDVVDLVEWLRRDFLLTSKSILRYISIRFNIQNETIVDWAYLVEKGLNSKMQILMMQKGLSDRSVLHAIDKLVFHNIRMTENKNVLHSFLRKRKDEVVYALAKEGLPALSLKHVKEYLQ